MTKPCPVCNFMLKDHEEIAVDNYLKVHCHECGSYMMDIDCAKDFRRRHLSFDVSSVGGRELYDHNMRAIRAYLIRNHKDVVTDKQVSGIAGLYRPRQ